MKKDFRYDFKYIYNCNMCGSETDSHKILGKRLNQSQGRNPTTKVGITTTVAKCTNCQLIYSNPQPIPFNIQDHYSVTPEEYWHPSYFLVEENYFKDEIIKLKSLIAFKPGMKALDIGSGLGKGMIALEKAGFDTFGFEPSQQFYERSISEMGINSNKLKVGQIEEIEYESDSFEFISFGAVLEHVYDPSASILKALKWLKPKGIIHIEVPSSTWLVNKMINFFYKLRRGDYVGNLSPMHNPYHLYEFGVKSFKEHAEKNNYELAHYEHLVCETFMPKFADYFIKPYMKFTNTGLQLCVWLRKV